METYDDPLFGKFSRASGKDMFSGSMLLTDGSTVPLYCHGSLQDLPAALEQAHQFAPVYLQRQGFQREAAAALPDTSLHPSFVTVNKGGVVEVFLETTAGRLRTVMVETDVEGDYIATTVTEG